MSLSSNKSASFDRASSFQSEDSSTISTGNYYKSLVFSASDVGLLPPPSAPQKSSPAAALQKRVRSFASTNSKGSRGSKSSKQNRGTTPTMPMSPSAKAKIIQKRFHKEEQLDRELSTLLKKYAIAETRDSASPGKSEERRGGGGRQGPPSQSWKIQRPPRHLNNPTTTSPRQLSPRHSSAKHSVASHIDTATLDVPSVSLSLGPSVSFGDPFPSKAALADRIEPVISTASSVVSEESVTLLASRSSMTPGGVRSVHPVTNPAPPDVQGPPGLVRRMGASKCKVADQEASAAAAAEAEAAHLAAVEAAAADTTAAAAVAAAQSKQCVSLASTSMETSDTGYTGSTAMDGTTASVHGGGGDFSTAAAGGDTTDCDPSIETASTGPSADTSVTQTLSNLSSQILMQRIDSGTGVVSPAAAASNSPGPHQQQAPQKLAVTVEDNNNHPNVTTPTTSATGTEAAPVEGEATDHRETIQHSSTPLLEPHMTIPVSPVASVISSVRAFFDSSPTSADTESTMVVSNSAKANAAKAAAPRPQQGQQLPPTVSLSAAEGDSTTVSEPTTADASLSVHDVSTVATADPAPAATPSGATVSFHNRGWTDLDEALEVLSQPSNASSKAAKADKKKQKKEAARAKKAWKRAKRTASAKNGSAPGLCGTLDNIMEAGKEKELERELNDWTVSEDQGDTAFGSSVTDDSIRAADSSSVSLSVTTAATAPEEPPQPDTMPTSTAEEPHPDMMHTLWKNMEVLSPKRALESCFGFDSKDSGNDNENPRTGDIGVVTSATSDIDESVDLDPVWSSEDSRGSKEEEAIPNDMIDTIDPQPSTTVSVEQDTTPAVATESLAEQSATTKRKGKSFKKKLANFFKSKKKLKKKIFRNSIGPLSRQGTKSSTVSPETSATESPTNDVHKVDTEGTEKASLLSPTDLSQAALAVVTEATEAAAAAAATMSNDNNNDNHTTTVSSTYRYDDTFDGVHETPRTQLASIREVWTPHSQSTEEGTEREDTDERRSNRE